MKENLSKLDLNAMKANQSVIIIILLAVFFLNLPSLVLLVGGFVAIGALLGVPGFYFVYRYCLKPLKIVRRDKPLHGVLRRLRQVFCRMKKIKPPVSTTSG